MSLEIIRGTIHRFNWIQVGCAPNHPQAGRIRDMSQYMNKQSGIQDSMCIVYPYKSYGDQNIVNYLIKQYDIDGILHFTDPRQWKWLYNIQNKLRTKVPIMYYNIWDNLPYPRFNQSYYQSCDLIMNISKQTNNIVKQVRQIQPVTQQNCVYVPHGINSNVFYPITNGDQKFQEFKKKLFGDNKYQFIFYTSNKNMRRKNMIDMIAEYRNFLKIIPNQKWKDVALMIKSSVADHFGTNFNDVIKDLLQPQMNIIFIDKNIPQEQLNYLYNIADVSINISSAQGFGLNFAQSVMAGTPVISIVTGGLQDQMRFVDQNNQWMQLDVNHPSNLDKKYTQCGKWAFPIFPYTTLAGTVEVPYIYDNYIMDGDLAKTMLNVYNKHRDKLKQYGKLGRQWMMQQGKMNHIAMCNSMILHMSRCIETFVPKQNFKLINVCKMFDCIKRTNKGIYNRNNNTWE